MNSKFLAGLGLAIAAGGFCGTAAAETRVHSLYADRENNVLYIDGYDFTGALALLEAPYVELNNQRLPLINSATSNTHLEAVLPDNLADGEYTVFVSRGLTTLGLSALAAAAHAVGISQRTYYSLTLSTAMPGPQGATGVQGPQGLQGLIGPQGPIGLTGAIGPQGLQGLTGPIGPQGLQGLTGPIGPQGLQGLQGLTGAIGPQGPIGLTGAIGPQGLQGLQGLTGAVGPQGLQGLIGPEGPLGPQGPIGPIGPAGQQGLQGLMGATGLRGPEGPQGATGPAGPQGAPGPAGAAGVSGLTLVNSTRVTLGAATKISAVAVCPAGKKVIGGGYALTGAGIDRVIPVVSAAYATDRYTVVVQRIYGVTGSVDANLVTQAFCATAN